MALALCIERTGRDTHTTIIILHTKLKHTVSFFPVSGQFHRDYVVILNCSFNDYVTSPVEFMTLPQLPVRPLELPRACLLLPILLTLERVPAARLSGRGWRRLLVT